jgi:hypothetical protein
MSHLTVQIDLNEKEQRALKILVAWYSDATGIDVTDEMALKWALIEAADVYGDEIEEASHA